MTELREAAERLSTLSGMSHYMRDQAAVDAVKVAEAWLAENLPDDNEPVTEEWLIDFSTSNSLPPERAFQLYRIARTDGGIEATITRGQVRLLLRALGQ